MHLKKNQPQEMFIIQQLILNFADFWQKNNIFTQNDQGFKKNLLQKKVINSIISHENCEFCQYSSK